MSLHIARSAIHGFGLFSDKPFALHEDVAIVFKRINDTGIFANDFRETPFGRGTNHSAIPNTEIILRPGDIILRAAKEINSNEEITASYTQLISLFNNDITLIKQVKFW